MGTLGTLGEDKPTGVPGQRASWKPRSSRARTEANKEGDVSSRKGNIVCFVVFPGQTLPFPSFLRPVAAAICFWWSVTSPCLASSCLEWRPGEESWWHSELEAVAGWARAGCAGHVASWEVLCSYWPSGSCAGRSSVKCGLKSFIWCDIFSCLICSWNLDVFLDLDCWKGNFPFKVCLFLIPASFTCSVLSFYV